MNALTIEIRGGWYSVCLDTTYLTENWKLIAENIKEIIFGLLFTTENTVKYCSFALMHCSCSMNNVRGVGPPKKKKKRRRQNAETRLPKCNPNGAIKWKSWGVVWYIISNTCFQFLNNITRIIHIFLPTHIFTHISNNKTHIFKYMYQTPPELSELRKIICARLIKSVCNLKK